MMIIQIALFTVCQEFFGKCAEIIVLVLTNLTADPRFQTHIFTASTRWISRPTEHSGPNSLRIHPWAGFKDNEGR